MIGVPFSQIRSVYPRTLEFRGYLRYVPAVAGLRVIPERVLVVEGDVGRVLEGAPAVRARRHAEQQAARGEQPIQLVDEGDLVGDVLQEVKGTDHADGAVRQAERVRER